MSLSRGWFGPFLSGRRSHASVKATRPQTLTGVSSPMDISLKMSLLKLQQIIQITGLSRATIYRLRKLGEFPQPRKLAPQRVAWLAEDLQDWIESRDIADTSSATDQERG